MVLWTAGFVLLTLVINAPLLPWVLRVTGLNKGIGYPRHLPADLLPCSYNQISGCFANLHDWSILDWLMGGCLFHFWLLDCCVGV